jgi:dihydrofolate reductase
MRKLIITEFITLDGMFEDPAPPPGYAHPDIGKFKHDELFESGALMLGRVTYKGFAKYWPTMQGSSDFANRMNNLPKFVATTTLKNLEWNASRLEGDIVTAVKELKQQDGQNILVYGSGTFAQTLLKHRLADELRLLVYPLVRGTGRRFFTGEEKLSLKLVDSREMGAGVMLLTYEPALES